MIFKRRQLSLLLVSCWLLLVACDSGGSTAHNGQNQNNANNAATVTSPTAAPPKQRTFEEDLSYVRAGRFKQILVVTRKDNADFTGEDVEYLTDNQPFQTNQRVFSEGRRRVVIGTNFPFKPENLAALEKRFNVQDYTNQ